MDGWMGEWMNRWIDGWMRDFSVKGGKRMQTYTYA